MTPAQAAPVPAEAHGADGARLAVLRWDRDDALAALDDRGWHALLECLAAKNGLLLLERRLRHARRDMPVPVFVRELLRARRREAATKALRAVSTLANCIRMADRPLLLLKGIDISQRIYGGLGGRAMGDVDLLVRPEDIPAFHAALLASGYVTKEEPTRKRMEDPLWSQSFYAPPHGGLFPIELHWRLGNDRFSDAIDLAGVWARSESTPLIADARARVMSREDLLLYLCAHIRHHTFDTPLTHVWDLAELVAWAGTDFDWDAFWQRAAAWHLTETVQLAFRQLEATLGVTVAQSGADAIPPDVVRMLPDVLSNLGSHQSRHHVAEPHLAELFAPSIPLRDRLARIAATLFAPRDHLAARYSVAANSWRLFALYPAYWWRLASNHRRKLGQWVSGDATLRAQANRVHSLAEWLNRER